MIRNLGPSQQRKKSSGSTKKPLPEEYQQLKHSLADHFNTNIDVKRNDNGKGKIVIPFKSDKDLERIMSIINQGKEE